MKKSVVTTFLLVILCQNILFAKTDPNDNAESQALFDAQLLKASKDLDLNAVRAALGAGANPNANNAKEAIEFGIDPNYLRLARLDTPLNRAVSLRLESNTSSYSERIESENRCMQILNLLFEAGAKTGIYDDKILYWPVIYNYPKIVNLLLRKGANPNNTSGAMTFVELAESYGHKEIAHELISYGGKPVPPQEILQLHFIHITKYGTLIEMEEQLEKGASVNTQTRLGRTALLGLLNWGRFDLEVYAKISFLLQKGANPNLEAVLMMNKVPQLPLHTAMLHSTRAFESNFPEGAETYAKLIIEALIKAGADVSAHGINGATPLQIAVLYHNIIGTKMLIEAGVDVSAYGRDGTTPLHAAININLKLAEMLIEAGADVSAPITVNDKQKNSGRKDIQSILGGMTPLHYAIQMNNLEGAKMLIKAGADVSSRNEDGQTPLHIAAEYDNLKGAILLIEKEAKVMEKDNLGRTPLDYAKSTMMTKLLKSHGAKEQ